MALLPDAFNIGIFAGNIALVAALVIFGLQMRDDRKSRGYSAFLQAALQDVELERTMMHDKDLREIYDQDIDYLTLKEPARKRRHFYYMMLIVGEIVYLSHKKGWMDKEEWGGWDIYMKYMVSSGSDFKDTWKDSKSFYSEDFREYIDSLTNGKMEAPKAKAEGKKVIMEFETEAEAKTFATTLKSQEKESWWKNLRHPLGALKKASR